jgi:glutamate formiminotransferase/formiminotetrahydrofolate cyclodeaminase
MSRAIVECVPNFSEARRPEVVESIMNAIQAVPGVHLLDRHSDADHNRTVLTFAGGPKDVEEAAFQAISKAAKLIDLEQHHGEHPRIGATDVVPFVPVSGVTMQECVEIAQRLGKRVGNELGIPVYLYEEAATRPERHNLENIRRGQYEALKKEIATNPERIPDFGPRAVGPAGATVIGARQFLIAFNVYLSTADVTIAKKIAKAIRYSSGGLRYVKALGLLVEGRAQVSMNLTNFTETPVALVVEMIRSEAIRYGVSIHHSELVGLIPEAALVDVAVWHLQLDGFKPEQVLEQRLAPATQDTQASISTTFLDALAAGTAVPGGGSASAYSGAVAAALVAMVARLTVGKKKYAAVEPRMVEIVNQAETLRSQLTYAVEEDAQAFEVVMQAFKLPKATAKEVDERNKAIENATLKAAQVPLSVAQRAVQVMELAEEVIKTGNINAISDGATGAAHARAALDGAGYNVRINAKNLADTSRAEALLVGLRDLEQRATYLEDRIHKELHKRGGISS